MTKLFRLDALHLDPRAVEEICRDVLSGKLVVFPTETVYGLGASIYTPEAVRRIYTAKNRPMDNPLIIHISRREHLQEVAAHIPDTAWRIVEVAWPGPLTLVLKKGRAVPPEASAGLPTAAIRMPAHPVAEKLIDCTGPVAAPSANISGRPSPTTGHHVLVDMFGRADIIVDAGETLFGIESTIVDVSVEPPRLLRPGAMPIERITEILGVEIVVTDTSRGYTEAEKALAPGMKYRHYAPKTPLILVEGSGPRGLVEVVEEIRREGKRVAVIVSRENLKLYQGVADRVVAVGSIENLFEVAKNLFIALRELDRFGVDVAVSESFPERGIGLAVMNRLRKASTKIIRLNS